MRLKLFLVLSFAVLLALAGCRGMVEPTDEPTLTVMTYNIYIGRRHLCDHGPCVASRGVGLYANIVASNFLVRAAAIARFVKETQPHLIGLQEVSVIGPQVPFSYREILMGAFEAAELDYEVVAEVQNADIRLCASAVTDFDLILARHDVDVARPIDANYTASLTLQLPGVGDLKVLRGYAAIDATVAGVTYRVVNTHLEATLDALPGALQATQAIRVMQAQELVDSLSAETAPVILLGDFNTPAPDGAAYRLLLEAGYSDVWQTDSEASGNTCCQDADLRNEESGLGKRIDQIFIKGVSLREGAAIRTATVGDKAEDKTPGGLWPSDHAGVVAHLPVE